MAASKVSKEPGLLSVDTAKVPPGASWVTTVALKHLPLPWEQWWSEVPGAVTHTHPSSSCPCNQCLPVHCPQPPVTPWCSDTAFSLNMAWGKELVQCPGVGAHGWVSLGGCHWVGVPVQVSLSGGP